MNKILAKLKKAFAIALIALQIPVLMFWKITSDAVKCDCHEIILLTGGAIC